MLLVVYGLAVLVFMALFLAWAAQGAPLPPKPVYPVRIEAVAAQHPLNAVHSPVWCERTRLFRDPHTGRFVARSKVV
jgi:hypothetical protein